MMTDDNLPDMSSVDFVKYVERTTRLPIVMMCDTRETAVDGYMSGAMMCVLKPVRPEYIDYLRQLPILKKKQIRIESHQSPMLRIPKEEPVHGTTNQVSVDASEFRQVSVSQKNGPVMLESNNVSQNYRKRKMDEMQIGCDWSMGQTSPFISTPDLNSKFLKVAQDFGISNAAPSAVPCYINAPGVTQMFQPLQQYTTLQQNLSSRMVYAATPAIAPNPSFMMGQYMGQATRNNQQMVYKQQQYSPITMFMQDPYCREQLKMIVHGSLLRWAAEHGTFANSVTLIWAMNNFALAQGLAQYPPPVSAFGSMWNAPPHPSAIVFPGASTIQPMSVLAAVARALEKFIYSVLNAVNAPGFMAASRELLGGADLFGLGFLGNAAEIYYAIIKLLEV
ncbi:hypothetical protein RND81_01G199600 [Saponaria officinalis]|uniref:Response regulatory domain-containing protein n=1 Tax=Saponaria officinalis TaxID=3572 RepID=A0AAW1NH66_SAPOF